MGLLEFFRRKGGLDRSPDRGPEAGGPTDIDERDEVSVGPPGFGAEGPPVGTSDPGSLSEGGPPNDEGAAER